MRSESDWSVDHRQVTPGAEVKFQCYALCADRYVAPALKAPSLERTVALALGTANTGATPYDPRASTLLLYVCGHRSTSSGIRGAAIRHTAHGDSRTTASKSMRTG